MGGNELWGEGFKTESGRKLTKNVMRYQLPRLSLRGAVQTWLHLAPGPASLPSCVFLKHFSPYYRAFEHALPSAQPTPHPQGLPDEHLIILPQGAPANHQDPGVPLPRTNPHHACR